ncbi:MAG: 30S ribosomal protein S7 [Candidatus Eremiobacteraeota bacterium]|nr:30S ribosomal protein S7 [Candidatus Eremiobacteraeota bacterium]
MPRKGPVEKRKVFVDPVYGDEVIARFINKLMLRGKKCTAERIFYGSMDTISKKTGKDPVKVFKMAMENVSPQVEVRPRRVGGATYQVPMEVRPERKRALAMRWLIGFTRKRGGKTMQEKLANELMDASQGVGAAVKKREDTHKMAEANKAFAHYRW